MSANRVAAINPPIDDTDPIRKFSIDSGSHTDWQKQAEFSPKGKPIRNFSINPTSSIRTRLRTPFLRTPFPRLLVCGPPFRLSQIIFQLFVMILFLWAVQHFARYDRKPRKNAEKSESKTLFDGNMGYPRERERQPEREREQKQEQEEESRLTSSAWRDVERARARSRVLCFTMGTWQNW